ncbi:TetR/AcrR family transcriptional regulator [Secundilactobacillus malefermentans]|uniref:HTH tetR-type domain-containing protein n=1 Tax=Secundilactobacillus malefermentans TaxID=176292 RepID=A0A4R5NT39_9LACO|nr:TetR/AcrR family transcriptional regulator [Secundilactobacillus malefermentans]KRM59338.1 TetR family transcriptional regulator [Secundilactobacillus malefermentans DSM 5705 = KCTC 3548]QEA31712.1 TetR/AcrR family transcriptional regulator [Secundilactobacillus malefermentans]TDG79947.1 hypothetical protein C5L31_002166 [Secundilactobacillus malefermentans]
MAINNVEALFAETLNETDLTGKQKDVLRASLSLFSEKGFSQTSTPDIARLAGVSEGTVYKQFKTKEGILRAILAPVVQNVFPKAADEFATDVLEVSYPSLETFLTSLVENRLNFIVDNQKQLRVLLQEVLFNEGLVQQIRTAFMERVYGPIDSALSHYRDNGEIVNWQTGRMIRYVVSTVVSYGIQIIMMPEFTVDTKASTKEIVEFLMRGLKV